MEEIDQTKEEDENGWQDLEESVREADAVAEMLLAKAREIKAE